MSSRSIKAEPLEPLRDLHAERAEVVRTYLQKSVELTESLLRENRSLEQELVALRADSVRIREHLSQNDTIRDLLVNIEGLERERKSLQKSAEELENAFEQHSERSAEVEQELNNLVSLYVASSQLSGTLSIGRVIKHMCELLEQLVGAQSFAIYIVSGDGTRGVPVGSRGHNQSQLPSVSVDEGVIGDVCLTGVARIFEPDQQRNPSAPIAVLPLSFDSEVVGVIAIHKLLPHKRSWASVDRELFKLLSTQGAVALIAANLYAKEAGARAALHDVLFHLDNERIRQLTEAESEGGGDA